MDFDLVPDAGLAGKSGDLPPWVDPDDLIVVARA